MKSSVGDDPYVLTVRETAGYLRLSEMTVLRLAHQGLIQGAKIGRQWRFAKETILALVKHPEILRRMELRR